MSDAQASAQASSRVLRPRLPRSAAASSTEYDEQHPDHKYPFVLPVWDDSNCYVEPTNDFGVTPTISDKARMLKHYRGRFSEEEMKLVTCCVCSRSQPKRQSHSMPFVEYYEKFRDNLCPSDALKRFVTGPPSKHFERQLSGHMLDWNGVSFVRKSATFTVCSKCYSHNNPHCPPPYALANGMFTGTLPECMKDLSVVEECLIGLYFPRGMVFSLGGKGPTSSLQRGFTGHVVSFPLNTASTRAALLPRRPNVIAENIAVTYYGRSLDRQQVVEKYGGTANKLFYVRRTVVREALEWLIANNHYYAGMRVDEGCLDALPENGVPETIWETSFRCVGDDEVVDSTQGNFITSYCRAGGQPRDANGAGANEAGIAAAPAVGVENGAGIAAAPAGAVSVDPPDSSAARTTTTSVGADNCGIASAGVTDMNGTGVDARYVRKKTLELLFRLKVGVGQRAANEYEDIGALLAGSYPTQFPYGIGAPGSVDRVSLHNHATYLMEHSDARFQQHRLFLFGLLNIIQRRAACYAAKAIVKHNDIRSLSADLGSVSDEDLRAALTVLDSGGPMSTAMQRIPDSVRRVLSKVNFVAHAVPASGHARKQLLAKVYTMVYSLGPPTLFVTINPHDAGSSVLMRWATGQGNLDLDVPMQGVQLQRYKIVSQHPALAARFFDEVCQAFYQIILGGRFKGKGIFGRTAGYFGVTEAQGRGTLHCHNVVWLTGSGTSDGIREVLSREGPDGPFRKKLIGYYDDIICTALGSLTKKTTGDDDVTEEVEKVGDPGEERPPDLGIPTTTASIVQFSEDYKADGDRVAFKCNMHNPAHTFSCFKGDKLVCRYGFPKECHEATYFDDELGGIVGQRHCPYLNSFNVFMASTLRCNHDVKFIQSTADCRATIHYIVAYMTKSELTAHTLMRVLSVSLAESKAHVAAAQASGNTPVDLTVKTVQRTLMRLISASEISAPQACQVLLQQPIFYTSHDECFVPFGIARSHLIRCGNKVTGALESIPVDTSILGSNNEATDTDDEETSNTDDTDEDPSHTEDTDPDDEEPEPSRDISSVPGDDKPDIESDLILPVQGSVNGQPATLPDEYEDDDGFPVALTPKTVDGDTISVHSRLLDYTLRPDEWETDSLLHFTLTAQKTKIDPEYVEEAEGTEKRRGRRPQKRFRFKPDHPQYATHWVYRIAKNAESLPLPHLSGGTVPRQNVQDELYCVSVLSLCFPWRSIHDLWTDGASSWCAAYANLIKPDLGTVVSPTALNLLNNIEMMHRVGESRNADLRIRDERERQQLLMQGIRREPVDREHFDEAVELQQLAELTEQFDPDLLNVAETVRESHDDVAMQQLRQAVGSHSDLGRQQVRARAADPDITPAPEGSTALAKRCVAKLKSLRATIYTARPPQQQPVVQPTGGVSAAATSTANRDLCQASDFATTRGLNVEQRACFMSFVEHAERTFLNLGNTTMPTPDMWILTGEGGSGKTHTIQCIVDYFELRGWRQHMRVTATTGAAAANLQRNASTIDTVARLGWRSKRPSSSPQAAATLQDALGLADVYYLIVDEYSMLSCEKLTAICRKLGVNTGETGAPAGRISILFAGDPHQFQPVQGTALSKFAEKVEKVGKSKGMHRETDVDAVLGATLWSSIKNVIVLTENYRQSACPQIHGMLARMRGGSLNSDDCELLKTRLLNRTEQLTAPELLETQFIVQRNSLRLKMNETLDAVACAATGKVGVVVYSEDVLTSTGTPPDSKVQAWIDVHGKPVENLPRRAVYHIGQTIRFTKNICPEYGVANGALGEIVGIYCDPDEPDDIVYEGQLRRLQYLPSLILVKVPSLDVQLDDSLPVGVLPVSPIVASDKLDVTPLDSSSPIKIRYSRKAFPLIPTRCITDYKAQGSGFKRVVIDLDYPPSGAKDFGLAVYVMISRAKTLATLYILRQFDASKLMTAFPEYIRTEWRRMVALSTDFIASQRRN